MMQQPSTAISDGVEPPIRYLTARKTIGVSTASEYLRTLVGGAYLFGLPLVLARQHARHGDRRALHAVERWWARRLLAHLRVRLVIEGSEQIDPRETYVVTPLHEGFADIPALLHLPLNLRFAARDEIFTWRVLGPYLRDTGQLCVTPERGRWSYRRLLLHARSVFTTGESLVIFPQGTILGIETNFLRGAFALAHAMGRPILPIALTGSHRVWEHPFTPRLRYGQQISLRVLPPVAVDQLGARDVDALRSEIQQRVKAAALSGDMAAPRHYVPARDGYWDGFAFQIDPAFPALAADVAQHRARVADEQQIESSAADRCAA